MANGSIRFAHVLSAQQDKVVSMKMAALPGDSSVKFKMEKGAFEEIANTYEESITRLQSQPNRLRMSLAVHQNLMEQNTY